jgi:hypothetical protein
LINVFFKKLLAGQAQRALEIKMTGNLPLVVLNGDLIILVLVHRQKF